MWTRSDIADLLQFAAEAGLRAAPEVEEITASALFGSHAYNDFAHRGSDLDAILVVRLKEGMDDQNWHIQVAGARRGKLFEMNYYTRASLTQALLYGTITLSYGLHRGYTVLEDRGGAFNRAHEIAEQRLRAECMRLAEGLASRALVDLVSEIRVHFTDARNVLSADRLNRHATVRLSRLAEYIVDFFLRFQVSLYMLDSQLFGSERSSSDERQCALLKSVIVMGAFRGARMLDYEKYVLDSRATDVVRRLSAVLERGSLSEMIGAVFEVFDSAMREHFGCSLFLEKEESLGAWIPSRYRSGGFEEWSTPPHTWK